MSRRGNGNAVLSSTGGFIVRTQPTASRGAITKAVMRMEVPKPRDRSDALRNFEKDHLLQEMNLYRKTRPTSKHKGELNEMETYWL